MGANEDSAEHKDSACLISGPDTISPRVLTRGYTRKLRQRELEDGQGMREGTVPGSKILLVPSHA
jgi:hypothetical protein